MGRHRGPGVLRSDETHERSAKRQQKHLELWWPKSPSQVVCGGRCPGRKPHPPDNGPRSDLQHTPLMGVDCPSRACSACLPWSTGFSDPYALHWFLWSTPPSSSPGHLGTESFSALPSISLAAASNSLSFIAELRSHASPQPIASGSSSSPAWSGGGRRPSLSSSPIRSVADIAEASGCSGGSSLAIGVGAPGSPWKPSL